MKRGTLGLADRIALIALCGIIISLMIWFVYALVDGVLFGGHDLTTELVYPSPLDAWNRLVAIIGVLIGTLAVQIVSARRIQTEQQLRVEQSRTRQMYENSPDSVVCMSADRTVVYANLPAERIAGHPISTDDLCVCHETLYGRKSPCPGCGLNEVLRTGQVQTSLDREVLKDGSERWLSKTLYPILDSAGGIESIVETARDVTDLRIAEEQLLRSYQELEERVALRTHELSSTNARLTHEIGERERISSALIESEERYRQLVEQSPDMVLVHRDQRVTYINPAGLSLLGAESLEQATGHGLMSLWAPNGSGLSSSDLEHALQHGRLDRPLPLRLKRLDGNEVDVEVTVSRVMLDGEDFVQCVARDITERLRAEETIRRMAFYDMLTDLPNRQLFRDRLTNSVARALRNKTTLAVAFIDLDDFKAINDTLGHAIGDELLKAVGARIDGLLREGDTVARHSGDEFTVLAELKSPEDARLLATRLLDGLRPAFSVQGHDLHVTGSLGIALYPRDGADSSELLKNADTAMYHAKDLGQSQYELYQPDMGRAAKDRLELETELRRAIDERQFELYYQPQVDLGSKRIVAVEALLRWNHPERGVVAPGDFLNVAEQAGLIGHLGRWVLAEACMQLRTWRDDGIDVDRVAVNLSAQEFLHHDVVDTVAQTLAHTGISGDMLELEITESVAIHNLDQVLSTLTGLRALGVRIAIDDFGTGYSSMGYLQRFPIQTLKIAQTFMRDVDSDDQSAAIASMLVSLCRRLNLDIVAEGVECESQLAFLEAHSPLIIQGNLYCEARRAAQIAEVLRNGIAIKT